MKLLLGILILLTAVGAGFFLFASPRVAVFKGSADISASLLPFQNFPQNIPSVPEASAPASPELRRGEPSSSLEVPAPRSGNAPADIGNQKPLPSPPEIINAIYLTGWSAGSESKLNSLSDFIQKRGLNAVVVDIKDYSGYVSYAMDVPEVKASGAENQIRIARPNALIKELHDKGIYVIGRITVFQDPILAKAHPEWALKNKITGKVWLDNHGLSWLDPAATPVWNYDISIAKDALGRGFDEVNFDYVRFASDGDVAIIGYPFWNQTTPRHAVIKNFFAYLREHLPNAKISADLFGLSTSAQDDLGIGQVIEDAYHYFDYVSPMVYPSHYAPGTLGYKNPAQHPYEVIQYSMEHALSRLNAYESATSSASFSHPKLRPWLQAFDLGAVYDSAMIDAEIKAVDNVFFKNESSTSSQHPAAGNQFGGWLLWDPANNYSSYHG